MTINEYLIANPLTEDEVKFYSRHIKSYPYKPTKIGEPIPRVRSNIESKLALIWYKMGFTDPMELNRILDRVDNDNRNSQ